MYNFGVIYEYNGIKLKRISKNKVDKLLKTKKTITIYTLPCHANYKSPWIDGFFEVEKNQYCDYYDCVNQLAEIKYYNCNKDLGKYLVFFIKENDEEVGENEE